MMKSHDSASHVAAEHGDVHVSGPNGVAYSMTPDAAVETSDRLRASAAEARAQQTRKPGGIATDVPRAEAGLPSGIGVVG